MTTEPCQMTPLVEASLDGRLGDREQRAVDRHLVTCAECAQMARDLTFIAKAVQVSWPRPPALEQERRRLRLLREAAVPTPRTLGRNVVLALTASLASLVFIALALVGRAHHPTEQPAISEPHSSLERPEPPTSLTTPVVQTRAEDPQSTSDAREACATAAIDGGTALGGDPPGPVEPRHSARDPRALPAGTAALIAPPPGNSAAIPDETSIAFAEAIALVDSGDYARAATKLEIFEHLHPSDARAESAAFMAIVALERAGRDPDAVLAARRYLDRYPNGARRAEVEAIAHEP